MIAQFDDHLYPKQPITHIRDTARALIVNENNEFLFLHIKGEDLFGVRDHYETVGGGVEIDESMEQTIHREIIEESGYLNATIIAALGVIEDTYYLIGRKTRSHFFIAYVDSTLQGDTHRTAIEQELIHELVWIPAHEVEALLNPKRQKGTIGELVHQRDLAAFQYYQKHKKM